MQLERGFQFVAGIAAIGKEMPQPGKALADRFDEITGTVAVLPFIWRADPDEIIAARNRGSHMLESIR